MNEELVKVKQKIKKPSPFAVLLLNDDYTTQDFVIKVLQQFFHKNMGEATSLMLKVHNEGEAICGTYSYDIAQTKVEQVISYARDNDHPLMCVLREVK
jgi:ATP-dependent Clp protease adaptor protein ClpS